MTRINQLHPEYVEFIPEHLQHGVLYISKRYSTANHLCCCGCGQEVVTPLNPVKWRLTETNGMVSLYPSIGNWGFACQSHYWIKNNRILWAEAMAPEEIAFVRAQDRTDAEALTSKPEGLLILIRFGKWLFSPDFS